MDLKNKTKYSTLIEWSGILSQESELSKIEFFDFLSKGKLKIQNYHFMEAWHAV